MPRHITSLGVVRSNEPFFLWQPLYGFGFHSSVSSELARPTDAAAYVERLHAYLDAHPAFYGSGAALLDQDGRVTASPYVYRTADGYATVDLAVRSYNIESQEWFTAPLAANAGVWTAPYFDAGGGEIWMITRSVPVRDAEGVFALVGTDLPVEEPRPVTPA